MVVYVCGRGFILRNILTQLWGLENLSSVRQAVTNTIPKKKKCKKAKRLSEEALQIAVKRREAKSKGEKESYTHLNSEFQE